jgi:signal recognition particle receptor subunit beta
MIGYINIFNGAMWTGFYTLFAALAILLVDNADMPMWAHFKFSQHLIRTSIQAFPTGVAITRSDLYKFCHSVTLKKTIEFHLLLLLLIA